MHVNSAHNRGPGPIPPRWLSCPRKSVQLIGKKFLAFKTPLDEKYDDQVPMQYRFPSKNIDWFPKNSSRFDRISKKSPDLFIFLFLTSGRNICMRD